MRYKVLQVARNLLAEGTATASANDIWLVIDTTPTTGETYPIAIYRCRNMTDAQALAATLNA
jgi:hypothetical protein